MNMTFQETQVLTKDGFSTYENSPTNLGATHDANEAMYPSHL